MSTSERDRKRKVKPTIAEAEPIQTYLNSARSLELDKQKLMGTLPAAGTQPKAKRRPGKTTVQLDESTVAELRRQALPGEVLEDAVRRLAGMAPVPRKHAAWSPHQKRDPRQD